MKRWHEEKHIYVRRFWSYESWIDRLAQSRGDVNDDCRRGSPGSPRKLRQYGRYRKRKPFDCGHARCSCCPFTKFPKRWTTYQEWVSDLKFREGLKDL